MLANVTLERRYDKVNRSGTQALNHPVVNRFHERDEIGMLRLS